MNLSVIVCTHNRCDHLERCLESLIAQELPPARLEVIVVDNRSTDGTTELCRRYTVHPHFRYLYEETLGLSHARNRGAREARFGQVAFIDDDATAVPQWAAQLAEAFRDPAVGSAGGPILPELECSAPRWFHPSLLPLYSCRERGSEVFDLPAGLFFYGANMAFRRDLLLGVGGFPVHLGRKGGSLLSDEELVVSQKVEAMGFRKRYFPAAVVRHAIPAGRLRAGWLVRRCYWLGKGNAIRERQDARGVRELAAHLVRAVREAARYSVFPEYFAGGLTRILPAVILAGYAEGFLFGGGGE